MKVAIIGSGGVGGYFGGKIAKAGHDVTFLARGKHFEEIKRNGLKVKSVLGDFHLKNTKIEEKIENIGKVDFVILGVKAWQIKEVGPELSSILNRKATVLPLQNGVLAIEELSKFIPIESIIGGICRIVSFIENPGIISHTDVTPTIVFGEVDQKITKRVEKIKDLLNHSEIKSKISNNIASEIWKKFIGICISGLLALTKTTYGELRENELTRDLMVNLFTEIYQLSKLENVDIATDFISKTMSFIDSIDYDSTSSLTRDIWMGRPSELEYQNGTVVRLAKKHNFSVPINDFVYKCLLPMEEKARRV